MLGPEAEEELLRHLVEARLEGLLPTLLQKKLKKRRRKKASRKISNLDRICVLTKSQQRKRNPTKIWALDCLIKSSFYTDLSFGGNA